MNRKAKGVHFQLVNESEFKLMETRYSAGSLTVMKITVTYNIL